MPFQTIFDFRTSTRLIYGQGSLTSLAECFPDSRKILVATDPGLIGAGIVDRVTATLENAGLSHSVFSAIQGDPRSRFISAGHRQYVRDKCDGIAAVGGGSPMDVAKMIGVLASHGGRIDQYLGMGKVIDDLPPLVCLPTTYGTASEVTPFAVLTNPKTQNKDPVISWKIAPQAAILDPELSVALPPSIGGATGMDALTHALESYINLLATPITEGLALNAIQLVGDNVRLACANDYEMEATQNMLIASTLAGLAFSQTRLGNVHAMSHPVGARFAVHHGLANAILLPYVMEFNLQTRPEKFATIADALGADTEGLDLYEAARLAVDAVRELNEDLGIPEKLGSLGVKRTAIRAMSQAAMQSGNVAVNPRKTRQEDLEEIFKQAI
mgnify:FL=1